MGAKAQLRRDLIEAQQQRDQALARAERAEAAAVELEAILAELRPTKPGLVTQVRDRVRNWIDELAQGLGL